MPLHLPLHLIQVESQNFLWSTGFIINIFFNRYSDDLIEHPNLHAYFLHKH